MIYYTRRPFWILIIAKMRGWVMSLSTPNNRGRVLKRLRSTALSDGHTDTDLYGLREWNPGQNYALQERKIPELRGHFFILPFFLVPFIESAPLSISTWDQLLPFSFSAWKDIKT